MTEKEIEELKQEIQRWRTLLLNECQLADSLEKRLAQARQQTNKLDREWKRLKLKVVNAEELGLDELTLIGEYNELIDKSVDILLGVLGDPHDKEGSVATTTTTKKTINPDNPRECVRLMSNGDCMDKMIEQDPENPTSTKCPFLNEVSGGSAKSEVNETTLLEAEEGEDEQ